MDKIVYLNSNILESDNNQVFIKSVNVKNNLINLATEKFGIKLPNNKKCTAIKHKDGKVTYFLTMNKNKTNLKNCFIKLYKYCKKFDIRELSFPKISNNWHQFSKLINETLIKNGVNCKVFINRETIGAINENNFSICEDISKLQNKDKTINDLKSKLQQNKLKGFIIEDNVLLKLRKCKNKIFKQLVVPQAIKKDILQLCHDNFTGAHLGHKKTWIKFSNRFYWPNSYSEVKNYVESCEVCAKIKSPPPNRAELKPITDFSKPFDMVAVDILELSTTSSGNRYVVVFTDYLTKLV